MSWRSRRSLASFGFAMLTVFGVAVCVLAYLMGALANALFLLLPLLALAGVGATIIGAARGRLTTALLRQPLAKGSRLYWLQLVNRWLFLAAAAAALGMALIPIQFAADEYRSIRVLIWAAVTVLAALALVPQQRLRVSPNVFFTIAWLLIGVELLRIAVPPGEAVELEHPVRAESYVFHGGRSALVNHHYAIASQRHALDIVMLADGRTRTGDAAGLESYPCFGTPLHAPAGGRVVVAIDDRPDMPIGESDLEHIAGNQLVIEIGPRRYVMLAHLKQASLRVKAGDIVAAGHPVAACGNSGNTSEPHLHLQAQDRAAFDAPGMRSLPMRFRGLEVVRDGEAWRPMLADLRRNDRVRPALP